MGSSATAYLRFGYVLPEREYPDDYDWNTHEDDDSDSVEAAWVKVHAPEPVKSLELTPKETAERNALPNHSSYGPDKRTPVQVERAEYFSNKSSVYYAAKREWLKENPCEVELGVIGHYEGEEHFLYYQGPTTNYRSDFEIAANWEAAPVDLNASMFQLDAAMAKEKLDEVCRLLNREPKEDPQWCIYPNYG